MSRFGIDYAWHVPITAAKAAELKRAGVTFVGRYFSNNVDSKTLTSQESRALSKAGIDTVCFWESTATRSTEGRAAGVADARKCLELARAVGMPDDRPFYFAIDADVKIGRSIRDYFKGVASVVGLDRTGVYGGYNQVAALFHAKLVRWGFQTYAWSAGKWYPEAQFRQYSNGHTVAGISCDYDTAVVSDFGQWRVGEQPHKPTPPPKPEPPKSPRDVEGPWPYGPHDYIGRIDVRSHGHDGSAPGDREHVRTWQLQLAERGWTVKHDGLFDLHDADVTREFQRAVGLPVKGIVDHRTWHHARFTPVTAAERKAQK